MDRRKKLRVSLKRLQHGEMCVPSWMNECINGWIDYIQGPVWMDG